MSIGPMLQCDVCLNRLLEKGYKCKAYPEGIPEKLKTQEYDHENNFPGDKGILFEQNPELPEPAEFK